MCECTAVCEFMGMCGCRGVCVVVFGCTGVCVGAWTRVWLHRYVCVEECV